MKILFLIEAHTKNSLAKNVPLERLHLGELHRMCKEAGIEKSSMHFHTFIPFVPSDSDYSNFYVKKKEALSGTLPVQVGKYLHPELLQDHKVMEAFQTKVTSLKPDIIVAMGNLSIWATLQTQVKPAQQRGIVYPLAFNKTFKVIPTYSISTINKMWKFRSITVVDLIKAKREATIKGIIRPKRTVYITENRKDIKDLTAYLLSEPDLLLSFDIETRYDMIRCISFSTKPHESFVIPFEGKTVANYWTQGDEIFAWKMVKKLLESPLSKLAQNGIFDMTYLWEMGIKTLNYTQDTMLLAHANYLELPRSLGFLASVYTNEPAFEGSSWKELVHHAETTKDD